MAKSSRFFSQASASAVELKLTKGKEYECIDLRSQRENGEAMYDYSISVDDATIYCDARCFNRYFNVVAKE